LEHELGILLLEQTNKLTVHEASYTSVRVNVHSYESDGLVSEEAEENSTRYALGVDEGLVILQYAGWINNVGRHFRLAVSHHNLKIVPDNLSANAFRPSREVRTLGHEARAENAG
jgi:hypothetical protein